MLNLVAPFIFLAFIALINGLNLASFTLFCIYFILVFYSEIYSFKFIKRAIFNEAFFSGGLKRLLSGRIFILFSSFVMALVFAFSFVFNALTITKFELIFIAFVVPPIFYIVKFSLLKLVKNSLKHPEILTKRAAVFISAIIVSTLYIFISFKFRSVEASGNLFAYLSMAKFDRSFSLGILNELYTYSFYLNSSFSWLENAASENFKIPLFIALVLNKILFFTSIALLASFSRVKSGYFVATIAILAFITTTFIALNGLNFKEQTLPPTKTQKLVDIVLINGAKLTMSRDEFLNLKRDLNLTKDSDLAFTKAEVSAYIDEFYDVGTRSLASRMADFKYHFLTDYLLLFHGVKDGNSSKFMSEKFSEFVNLSFDSNASAKLEMIISKNLDSYISNLYSNFSLNLDTNLTKFSLDDSRFKVSAATTLAASIAAKTIAKVGAKTAAKVGVKSAVSTAGGVSGAVCGPAAIVCVPTFAIATWFGVDYAVAKGEEALSRDEFEAQIYSDLMREKEIFKAQVTTELDKVYSEVLETLYEVEYHP